MPIRMFEGEKVLCLTRIDGEDVFSPGIRVCNKEWDGWGSKYAPGMVIGVEYEENCRAFPKSVTVLWPIVPTNDFSSITFPVVRHVIPPQYHQPINPYIQPMSQPSGLIFYLDYVYGSGSK